MACGGCFAGGGVRFWASHTPMYAATAALMAVIMGLIMRFGSMVIVGYGSLAAYSNASERVPRIPWLNM